MRVLRFVRVGVGAALALSVCATAAVGQQPPPAYPECTKKPTAEDVEAAKGAHTTAGQFYERGDYDSAIAQWLIAYNKFDCTAHGLLLNIANAQEKKGDKQGAIVSLQTYLDRMKQTAAPNVAQRLANLRAAVAPAPTVAPSTAPSVPPTAPTAPPTAVPTVAPTAVPTAVPTVAPPPDGQRPYGVYPWVTVGVGGALALTGLILLPVGESAISSASSHCEHPSQHTGCSSTAVTQGNTGRTEVIAGWATLSIGVVAVAGGLVWQLLYNKPQAAKATGARLDVVPVIGPGQGGLGMAGTF